MRYCPTNYVSMFFLIKGGEEEKMQVNYKHLKDIADISFI
jgi:hypothetical protein